MLSLSDYFKSKIFSEEDLNKALELSQIYGSVFWAADMGINDASDIETELVERIGKSLECVVKSNPEKDTVHVISEPYLIGGHTRLMERLASMHDSKPDLIITRSASAEVKARLNQFFNIQYEVVAAEPVAQTLEIAKLLSDYRNVVLHVHPDDIVCIVACGLLQASCSASTIYFVNHADHVFSFGSSVADYYFEISSYGARRDVKKKIIGKKSFLGIPVDRPVNSLVTHSLTDKDNLKFFSAASALKYKPRVGLSMSPVISMILDGYSNSTFHIVGANLFTNYWWWGLKLKYRNRFSVVPHLPFEEYKALLTQADFYVDSYPIPGGTAFAEQLIQGRRCIGLVSPIQGYSPADMLKSESKADILNDINAPRDYADAALMCVQMNGYSVVKQRYLNCIYNDTISVSDMEKYVPWTGDTDFMREGRKIKSPIPIETVIALVRIDKKLFFKLLSTLAMQQKIRVVVKLIIRQFTRALSK
jgi:hypothetical protein